MKESKHFSDMLNERGIKPEWVESAISSPDLKESKEDETCHFLKKIEENDNRWLRIIVNMTKEPNIKVTAFFDRRMRKSQ